MEKNDHPKIRGSRRVSDPTGGYSVWVPSNWIQVEIQNDRRGFVFYPAPDNTETYFSVEKKVLEIGVEKDDMPVIKEGFLKGINGLSNAVIESQSESITDEMMGLDARFTFQDGSNEKKQWIKVIYSGNSQLILIAQGANSKEFDKYLPIFFNIMMTLSLV